MSMPLKMVEVYSTTLSNTDQAKTLVRNILSHYPDLRINVDLEDCDNILRIEYDFELNRTQIEAISKKLGIQLRVLDD